MISIIIPVYNVEKIRFIFIAAVNSVLKQTYRDIELILVNDGSNDNSKVIIDNLVEKDKRIKVIEKENGGIESARWTIVKPVDTIS